MASKPVYYDLYDCGQYDGRYRAAELMVMLGIRHRQQIEHYSDVGILYQKRYTFVRAEDGNAPELADEWDRVTQVLKGCGHDLGRIPIVVSRDKRKEIKDIRRRIQKLDRFLEEPHQVSDTVKGTRRDGTIGSIKVTGYPVPEHYRKQRLRERYRLLLERKEAELLELTCQAEEYIQSIPKSEVRTMFRLYYIDGLPWWKVAQAMNRMFPKRRVKFTEDSCWQRNKRFFEEN